MNGIEGESGGATSREGLTEHIIRKVRDAIPAGRIPADPRGLPSKPGRGGIKRTRPEWKIKRPRNSSAEDSPFLEEDKLCYTALKDIQCGEPFVVG
jgi:hypothetical protein